MSSLFLIYNVFVHILSYLDQNGAKWID